MDEAFRRIYADEHLDFRKLARYDLSVLTAAIKQRVNVRMKRSGARWLAKHVGPFVELMAMADTPEWSEFWALAAA